MAGIVIDGTYPGQTEVEATWQAKRVLIRAEDAYQDEPTRKNKTALNQAWQNYESSKA